MSSAGIGSGMSFPTLTVGAGIWFYADPLSDAELKTVPGGVGSNLDVYYSGLNQAPCSQATPG